MYDVILFANLTTMLWDGRPLGVQRIASELRKHGYSVFVFNYANNWVSLELPLLIEVLKEKFVGSKTLFFGFSSVFMGEVSRKAETKHNWIWPGEVTDFENALIALKHAFPKVKIVFGGINDYASPKFKIVKEHADYVVEGIADKTIIDLASFLSNKSKSIKWSSSDGKAKFISYDPKGLTYNFPNSVTTFDYSDLVFKGEVLPLETSRGCLFKCDFCSYPLIGRKKSDPAYTKLLSNLEIELINNHENFNVTKYMIVDDTYNETVEKIERLSNIRKSLNIPIEFCAFIRIDLVSRFPEMVDILIESGLKTAFLGIESLNEKSAASIGKGAAPDKILRAAEKLKMAGVKLEGSFIIGLPHDSETTVKSWASEVIKSQIFENLHFAPLYFEENNWKSAISLNPEKYGYSVINQTAWKNQHFTAESATALSNELNQLLTEVNVVAGWEFLGMQNLNFSPDQLKNLKYSEINRQELSKRKDLRWAQYKSRILRNI